MEPRFALQGMYKRHEWSRISEFDSEDEAYRAKAAIEEYRRNLDYPKVSLRVIKF